MLYEVITPHVVETTIPKSRDCETMCNGWPLYVHTDCKELVEVSGKTMVWVFMQFNRMLVSWHHSDTACKSKWSSPKDLANNLKSSA